MTAKQNSFIVAQIGARMHYAIPRILFRRGLLARFYTDCYFPEGHWSHFWTKKFLSEMTLQKIARYRMDVPDELIRFNNCHGLATKAALARGTNAMHWARSLILASQRMAARVVRGERNATGLNVYGFDTASVEVFEWAASRGLKITLEQCVAPRATQRRVLSQVQRRAGLEVSEHELAAWEIFGAREQKEWRLANLIVCPSAYVQSELIASGAPANKIVVAPYGVAPNPPIETRNAMKRRSRDNPEKFRVFFGGELGPRKGILDLWEAAGKLKSQDYELVAAGRLDLPEKLAAKLPERIQLLGKCTRAQMAAEFANADCFVLPSHLEGSATVTYEALSWGLPVITTFSSGSVVEDGVSGFVGNAGDVDFLAQSLQRLREDASLRRQMAEAAYARSQEFTVDRYGERLMAAFEALHTRSGDTSRRSEMESHAVV